MRTNLRSEMQYLLLALLTISLFAYIHARPIELDDMAFCFKFPKETGSELGGVLCKMEYMHERIKSLSDVIESQKNFYQTVNSRVIPQGLNQFVLSIIGEWFYAVSLVVFIVCILYNVYKLLPFDAKESSSGLFPFLLLFCVFWWFLPSWSEMQASSVGFTFLIPIWLNLWFIRLYISLLEGRYINIWKLSIIALIGSLFLEGISISVDMALIFYTIYNKEKADRKSVFIILLYTLGTCFMFSSPGVWGRTTITFGEFGFSRILGYLDALTGAKIFIVLLGYICYLVHKKQLELKKFLADNLLIILTLIFSFGLSIALARGGRVSWFHEILSLILLLKLLLVHGKYSNFRYVPLLVSFCVITFLHIAYCTFLTYKERQRTEQLIVEYQNSSSGIVFDDELYEDGGYGGFVTRAFSFSEWNANAVSLYYSNNQKMMKILPEYTKSLFEENFDLLNYEKIPGDNPFYYIKRGIPYIISEIPLKGRKLDLEIVFMSFGDDPNMNVLIHAFGKQLDKIKSSKKTVQAEVIIDFISNNGIGLIKLGAKRTVKEINQIN